MNMEKYRGKIALVLGSSGFIGSHMVKRLQDEGYWVRGVDIKEPLYTKPDHFVQGDLRHREVVSRVMWGPDQSGTSQADEKFRGFSFDEVYQFAADMGGAGYIFTGENDYNVMSNSASINLNVAEFAVHFCVKKVFYSSSACIYPGNIQGLYESPALREEDAYPANPDSEYGWEKLFSERLYLAAARNHGLNVRIARFHNIYGPEGTWKGGKEKAPAAMIRKAIEAGCQDVPFPYIKVWGTGHQTRSFLYIDDCIEAVRRLMESEHREPINIGSEESVSINELAQMAIAFTGEELGIENVDGPVGVNGRNSDNTIVREALDWEPQVSLVKGMGLTYQWIKQQYDADKS